ncbi:hypothetical protein QJS10_CPB14g01172 [Acorus calamus]|uniref:Tudor domain-containing protein n=1 Tax=Acorus calamus TaxID=4465 RepID=A0AAV9DBB0_ACOCL|nr:hypothetical protein QJS10_CPB14g01172 [Acorus calamus]
MEDSVVKSDSTETSRKVRSLDLQSLYVEKPEVSKRKRHSKSRKGEAFISKKSRIRRKGRFEATLSDSESVPKKKRRGLGSNKSEKDGYDSEKKKNMSDKKKNNAGFSGLNSTSQSLGDKAIVIPKRPRGFSRRKKSESTAPLITEKVDANTPAPNSDKKRKKRLDESKENAFDNDEFDLKLKGEDDNLVVSRKRNFQKKNLVPEKRTLTEFGPLSVEDSTKFGEDPLEDDEENLEENAARMLSSRFDPSCTGFSPKSTNGSPFLQAASCRRDQGDSMGVTGRVLRPRRKDKGFARKRRHFYEVCSRDMDPYWVIKQRIRVFWPLDQSWYFGLVKDYNPVTKLHHVKYDDREEEWIDLQNERFKLLLFPSELRGKLKPGKSGGEGRNVTNRDDSGESSSNVSGFTDSEPIISWLARSRRVNSAPFNFSNKQKDSKLCKTLSAAHCSVLLQKDNSSCVVPEKSDSREVVKASELSCKVAKMPVVYFRKRFNTRKRVGSTLERSYGLLRFTSSPTKLWQVELKMRLPHLCVLDPSFAADRFWMHSSFLHLEYGTVMIVWPKVLLELLFVDNVMGLRCFLFRGCLRDAVALICKILATFYRPIKNEDKMDMNHPVTSFGLNLSGMQKQGGQLAYVFCSFLETHSSKWMRLDAKLKQFHMTVKELSLVELTYAKLRNLQCECEVPLLQGIDISEECKNTNTNNSYYMFTEKAAWSNSFGLSIASVPVPFLGMHLKFLMEKNATAIQKLNKAASQECVRNSEKLTDDSSPVEDSSDLSEITLDNVGCSVSQAISGSEWLSCSLPKVETDSLSVSNDAEWMRSTCNSLNGELNVAGNSSGHQDHRNGGADGSSARFRRCISHIGPLRDDERSCSSFPDDISSPDKSDPGCSVPNKVNSQTPMLRRATSQRYDRGPRPHLASDLSWNMNDFTFRSPNPTAPRSVWNRNKHSSVPSFSNSSKFWPDGGSDFLRNGSISGCRKPRSQISYLLPFGPGEIGSKPRSHCRRGRPYKKIKPDEEKKTSGGPANSQSRREPLICDANLLVSSGD